MVPRAMLPRIFFFVVVALLVWAELWFSNLGSLRNNLTGTAAFMGLTVDQQRLRLLTLIGLDAIAGIGALITIVGCLRNKVRLRRSGAMVTTVGLVLYGLFQILSALTQLPTEFSNTIILIGLVYIGIGIVTWVVGTRPTPDIHPAT